MSKPVAGLVAILALLFTILIIFFLGSKTKADELTWRKAIDLFRKAKSPSEKWFVVFLCSPLFIKSVGYVTFLGTIATAGFACIAVVFGDPVAVEGWLGLAKKIVKRAYPYIERNLHPAPPATSPHPLPSPTP
jgi:hypothetical protein